MPLKTYGQITFNVVGSIPVVGGASSAGARTLGNKVSWLDGFSVTDGGLASTANVTSEVELAAYIGIANELRTLMPLHAISTTEHAVGDGVSFLGLPPIASDLTSLKTLVTYLLLRYAQHENDAHAGSGWTYHVGTSNNALVSTAAPTTQAECVTRLNDLSTKYLAHDADAMSHTVAALFQNTRALNYYYTQPTDAFILVGGVTSSTMGVLLSTADMAVRGRVIVCKDLGNATAAPWQVGCEGFAEAIEGVPGSTVNVSTNYQVVRLISDGTQWFLF